MSIAHDLRFGVRHLRKQVGFTSIVVLTLSLTVGAATAVFGLFDAILLRPFPFREPDRLVRLRTYEPLTTGTTREASVYDFNDWRKHSHSFEEMAAYTSYSNNITGLGPARRVRMTWATPELFTVLGIQPMLGRVFTPEENQLGGDVRQLLLSYGLWQELFGSDPQVLGRTLQLRGQSFTIIGVMPPGFGYPDATEVWVPLMSRYATYKDEWWKRRDVRIHGVLARLRPEVTQDQAEAEMETIAAGLRRDYPDSNRNIHIRLVSLREAEAGALRPYIVLVSAAVFLLLLTGCINVAALFVARAVARERELAIQTSLGMSWVRLMRQLAAEALLYSVAGGMCGTLLAIFGLWILRYFIPVDLPSWMVFKVDARVLGFSLLVSIITTAVFALMPLIHQRKVDLNSVIKQGSKGSSGGDSAAHRVRSALVAIEVGLSVLLLVGAGLMLNSLHKLQTAPTGVRTDHLSVVSTGRYLPNVTKEQGLIGYSDQFRRMADRLLTLPGVRSVSGGDEVPFNRMDEQRETSEIYTRTRATREAAFRGLVQGADIMPGYFESLGIPLYEGRDFSEADTLGRPPVIIISRRTAELLFPGQSALGREIRFGTDSTDDPWMTIIGVVGNVRWHPAEKDPGLEVYWSYRQYPQPEMHFLLHTDRGIDSMAPQLRQALAEINPDFAISRIKTMDAIRVESVWQRRLWGLLLGCFAALSLVLAAVGVYGVMSYLVSQQTRTIGIRMALGAQRSSVVRHVVGRGMQFVLVGTAVGLVAALAGSRMIKALLYDVSPVEPFTYAAVVCVLGITAAIACAWPAWRASRIDPLIALREE